MLLWKKANDHRFHVWLSTKDGHFIFNKSGWFNLWMLFMMESEGNIQHLGSVVFGPTFSTRCFVPHLQLRAGREHFVANILLASLSGDINMLLCVFPYQWFPRCGSASAGFNNDPHWRLSHAVFQPRRPVSHSVRINGLSSLSSGFPLWQSASNPSASLRDMKATAFDPLFTNPHTARYILSPTFLFAALKKSDREASQLAASVPLLSYHGAAGCAGLKGSHWWAVLCRTEALLSNWKGPQQDDFRRITAGIVLSASSFPFPEPLLPLCFCFMMIHRFIHGDMDCTNFLLLKFCCCVILPPAYLFPSKIECRLTRQPQAKGTCPDPFMRVWLSIALTYRH